MGNVSGKMFLTLQKAIENRSDSDYIIAEDISTCGKKRFYTGTIQQLRSRQQLEKNQNTHWYECLMEHRPSRLFLDIDSTVSLDIKRIVDVLQQAILAKFKINGVIEILDSSGPNKFSWHIIVTNVILKNVYHVGAFVRRLVLFAGPLVDAVDTAPVDTAVYTRNRMFRMAGSCKMGSTRVLRSEKQWWELLIQVPCEHPLECLEIDESEPVSTSQKPRNLFRLNERNTWTRLSPQYSTLGSLTEQNPLLAPVLDWLDKHEQAQIIRRKVKLLETGFYVVPANSRKCYIANRTHKGNAIWYMIDLSTKRIYQRCLDDDCGKGRHLMKIDPSVWNKWSNAWMSIEPPVEPNNQNTLFNISY